MARLTGIVLAAAACLYLFYAVAMIWVAPRFLYPFDQRGFDGQGYRLVEVAVAGADPLPVQVLDGPPGAPVVVYFMGNVGALELFRAMLDHHRDKGRSVVAMTYRGGGGTPGRPSEAVLKRDALAVVDALPGLVPPGPVYLQGYSLGTGVAMHVAARRDVEGVLLAAPYDRLCDLLAAASWLPACWLPFLDHWDSASEAAAVTAPVLILHGTEDALIPVAQGERLSGRLANATFRRIEGAGHADLFGTPPYLDLIDGFLQRP